MLKVQLHSTVQFQTLLSTRKASSGTRSLCASTKVLSKALPYLVPCCTHQQDNGEQTMKETLWLKGWEFDPSEKQWIGQSMGSEPVKEEQRTMELWLAWRRYHRSTLAKRERTS